MDRIELDDSSIENKLLARDEFIKLDKMLKRFNIFEATDMGRREIKHTKFLSYLLDPNESHGLGEVFIKNFITKISEKISGFPRVLDLDFSFAEVYSEFQSIDCLLKIPFRVGNTASKVVVAIENKLDAKQGENQLQKYSEKLNELFPSDHVVKLYLIFNNSEIPNDQSWELITYGNLVFPVVKLTIDFLDETGGSQLKATLEDYLDLLSEDDDGDLEKEKLAAELIQDHDVKKYFDSRKKLNPILAFGDIYIKHKKAIDYLNNFDSDARTQSLTWWDRLRINKAEIQVPGYSSDLLFEKESSNRSYIRFSILSEQNRINLKKLSKSSRRWLESTCPLAFEIILVNDKKGGGFVKCWATLTLGPLDNYDDRENLINFIYEPLQKNTTRKGAINEYWNRLISSKRGEWTQLKAESTADPQKWIEEHVLFIDAQQGEIKLHKDIESIAKILNMSLDEYFKKIN